jgi:hypothetical protein
MNSTQLVDLFRAEMRDQVTPYLWIDEEAYGYLDEAQVRFCELTDGIADARTPIVTEIDITAGEEWYPTHPSIKQIRKATRADTGREVKLYTAEQADSAGILFSGGRVGNLAGLVLGIEANVMRATPVPNETTTVNLSVYRLPLVVITSEEDEQELEIPAQHHVSLLMWMKARAYDKQDAETFDRRKSDDFRARFEDYCVVAKRDQGRARRVQGNVVYGGI